MTTGRRQKTAQAIDESERRWANGKVQHGKDHFLLVDLECRATRSAEQPASTEKRQDPRRNDER